MNQYNNLIYEELNEIGIITLNRPKNLNALNSLLLMELECLVNDISENRGVKVIIIKGYGEKAFAAGADIKEVKVMTPIEARQFSKLGQRIFDKIERLPQIVIAAINGFALGGGCELAMACDIRIATKKSVFGQPEVILGVIPGFGGIQRLVRLAGKGVAKEILCIGENINAEEAYRLGLINKLVENEDYMEAAMKMAKKIILRGPLAVELCKSAINSDETAGNGYDIEAFSLCFSTNDQKKRMSAFTEKKQSL